MTLDTKILLQFVEMGSVSRLRFRRRLDAPANFTSFLSTAFHKQHLYLPYIIIKCMGKSKNKKLELISFTLLVHVHLRVFFMIYHDLFKMQYDIIQLIELFQFFILYVIIMLQLLVRFCRILVFILKTYEIHNLMSTYGK